MFVQQMSKITKIHKDHLIKEFYQLKIRRYHVKKITQPCMKASASQKSFVFCLLSKSE